MDNIYWARYTFKTDFTEHAKAISAFKTDEIITPEKGVALADVLNTADTKEGKDHWVSEEGSKEWNVVGAKVIHNGLNNTNYPTKASYSHVLVLFFPEQEAGPSGYFYLSYNVKP